MKYVEVGRFRVALNTTPDGAVLVDHCGPDLHGRPAPTTMVLEPHEILDLIVALDGVSNDVPPDKDTTTLHKIRAIMQETEHKLYKLGIRHRVEIHVESHELLQIAFEADAPVQHRPDTAKVLLGPYGALVAVRGRRV